jgi:hypothetical protein
MPYDECDDDDEFLDALDDDQDGNDDQTGEDQEVAQLQERLAQAE